MVTNLERIEYELKLAGYKLEPIPEGKFTEDSYVQSIGNCVWEICKLFASQNHSGMSASFTLQLLETLLIKEGTLTPLTNNPDEWIDCSEMSIKPTFQSKRKFACFSDDNLKTYYDVNDEKREKKPLKDYKEVRDGE